VVGPAAVSRRCCVGHRWPCCRLAAGGTLPLAGGCRCFSCHPGVVDAATPRSLCPVHMACASMLVAQLTNWLCEMLSEMITVDPHPAVRTIEDAAAGMVSGVGCFRTEFDSIFSIGTTEASQLDSEHYAAGEDFISGFAAVVGFTNVGKSTLVNRLVGDKVSIVTPKPQTTRSRVRGILNTPDMQVVFLDTPGVHRPQDRLGRQMVKKARQAVGDVDAIIFCVDGARKQPGRGDEMCADILSSADCPVILAVNKTDKISDDELDGRLKRYSKLGNFHQVTGISALTGTNVELLLEQVCEVLPRGGPRFFPPDVTTDRSLPFLIAELVRERVMMLTRQEIPYSTAVQVRNVEERSADIYYVSCDILVERKSQKGIVIGRKGKMIKEIGQSSRGEIEDLLGVSVYLDLHVRIRRDWRDDPRALSELQLELDE